MRADRVSFNGICRELNSEGIPCPGKIRYERGVTMAEKYKDALWIPGTVRKITQDAAYIGCRVHGKAMRSKVGLDKNGVRRMSGKSLKMHIRRLCRKNYLTMFRG